MPEKDEAVLTAFRRRRTRQLLAGVPAIAILAFFALRGEGEGLAVAGLSESVVGSALVVVAFGVLAFSLYNWRCPACNRYLGKAINPAFCSKCGSQLR